MSQRDNTITYLKTIGIILMVIGHSQCSIPYARQVIYMFHMPLFFFASGYCFNNSYLNQPKQFVKKRLRGLWWPYVKWSLLFLLLHNFFFSICFYSDHLGYGTYVPCRFTAVETLIRALLIGITMQGHDLLLGGYWFLPALFWGSVISFFLLKLLKKAWLACLVALLIDVFLNAIGWRVPLFYVGPQALAAATLFLAGHCFAYYHIPRFLWWQSALSLLLMVVGSFFWLCDMDSSFYNTYRLLPYLFTALLTVWSIYSLLSQMSIAQWVDSTLQFIGQHTITILTFHFVAFKLISLIIIRLHHLPVQQLSQFPVIDENSGGGWWWIGYTLAGIIIPLLPAMVVKWCRGTQNITN